MSDRADEIARDIVGQRLWLPSPLQDVEECVKVIADALRSYGDERVTQYRSSSIKLVSDSQS